MHKTVGARQKSESAKNYRTNRNR